MSLWACVEHGLTGPMACCRKASLASLTAVTQACSKVEIDAKDARIAALETRCEQQQNDFDALYSRNVFIEASLASNKQRIAELEAALRKLSQTCNGELGCKGYRVDEDLNLTASETAGKHPFIGDGGQPCVTCGLPYQNEVHEFRPQRSFE